MTFVKKNVLLHIYRVIFTVGNKKTYIYDENNIIKKLTVIHNNVIQINVLK